jgi:hypothetical protein
MVGRCSAKGDLLTVLCRPQAHVLSQPRSGHPKEPYGYDARAGSLDLLRQDGSGPLRRKAVLSPHSAEHGFAEVVLLAIISNTVLL